MLLAPRLALPCRMLHLPPGFQASSGARTFPLQFSSSSWTSLNYTNISNSLSWRMHVHKEGDVVLMDSRATTRRTRIWRVGGHCVLPTPRQTSASFTDEDAKSSSSCSRQRTRDAHRGPASHCVQWLDPELSKASAKHLTAAPALGRWCLSLWSLERRFLWYLSLYPYAAPYAAACALPAVP